MNWTIPFQRVSEVERGGMEGDKRRAVCACLAKREFLSLACGQPSNCHIATANTTSTSTKYSKTILHVRTFTRIPLAFSEF